MTVSATRVKRGPHKQKYDNLVRKAPRVEDPHVELKKRQT